MAQDPGAGSTRSSLERLKALDTLPNLSAQLREANRVCNHSARAEMISKWLLAKFKSDTDVSGSFEAWDTLLSALRLLSPPKVAAVLSSQDLLGTWRSTLENLTNGERSGVFLSFGRILKFLLEIAAGPEGTQVKAVLSVSPLQAASFLDIWIDSILTLVGISLFENGMARDALQPIFEIWNLRKRSTEENEIFAKHCFLSASRLLPLLHHYHSDRELKRRRDDDGAPQSSYKQMLESMLARHVFVPARTAFFKARDASETKAKRQVGSQDPTFTLRFMFEPLHNDDFNNTGLDAGQFAVLPGLFSVAVRCVSRLTPKQRTREKPWLDAVFKTLSECMHTLNSNSSAVREALRDMLSIANERQVALSKDILDDLLKRHSGLISGEDIDWKMISLILQIDSDVFSDDDMATMVLTEITNATVDLPKTAGVPLVEAIESGVHFMDLLRKQVILPIMKTFADQRQFGTFVDLWAAQINDSNHKNPMLIWADLAADFAPLLEECLSNNQVLALFDQYRAPIEAVTETQLISNEVDPASLPKLKSSIIILDAILSGVRSEELVDVLHERCGELFKALLGGQYDISVHVGEVKLPLASQLWTFMTKAFEMWFPAWATTLSNTTEIADMGSSIVRSNMYNVASSRPGRGENAFRAAQEFVACVCDHLRRYDQVNGEHGRGMPRRACLEFLEVNFGTGMPGEITWPILLQFPNLIADLSGDETISLIENCIKSATPPAAEALQALTAHMFQHLHNKKVDDLVEIFALYLTHKRRPEVDSDSDDEIVESLCEGYEIATLEALSGISPEVISRPHRERILNAVCAQQLAEIRPTWSDTAAAQAWRLVVLTSLMRVPNATCDLAMDAKELWRLTKSVSQEHPDQNLMPMVEELVVHLSAHLLATQDQERSRSMLIGFAEIIMNYIQEACTSGRVDSDGYEATLTVVMTLITRLEAGSKEELKEKFGYRKAEIINPFVAVCVHHVISNTEPAAFRYNVQDGTISADFFRPALKVLLPLPDVLLQFAKTDTDSWHRPLTMLIETCLAAIEGEIKRERTEYNKPAMRDVVVDAFQVLCKLSADVYVPKYFTFARDIAKLHITPKKRESFMSAFRSCVRKLSGVQYESLLYDLLRTLRVELDATAFFTLPLVEICVSNLDHTYQESDDSPIPRLLSRLLSLAELDPSVVVRKRAMKCVVTALKGNAPLFNQYSIEMTLQTAKRVLSNVSKARKIYFDICNALSILLLQYRSRLHGRFHLVGLVFQSLLSALFQPMNFSGPADEKINILTIKHAQAAAKLLSLFCDPPQSKRSSHASALVDEARKEQAFVGKSVQYVLHHYCSEVLKGKLGPGMKEALTPGLWSMIEAMEMGEAEGVKTLSAAMNNSERAVLRGVYDDWRRFGRWRGA